MSLKTIEVQGDGILDIAEALSSRAKFRIVQLLSKESLDISTIAKRLQISEAYVSEEVTSLERHAIIRTSYERGKRGVRKVCTLAVGKIVITLASGDPDITQRPQSEL